MGTPTRSDDLLASYSSKGPSPIDHVVKPDLVAPGNQIVSLLAQNGTLGLGEPQNVAPMGQYQYPAPRLDAIPVQPAYDPSSGKQPPGVKIGGGYSPKYFILNGTSMASAVVSGAVADLIQAAPSLTPDQVKMLLMQTSSKTFPTVSTVTDSTTGQTFTSYYDIFSVGAGYLDLAAALKAVNQVPAGFTAISPTANYDSGTGTVSLAFDASSVFSDKAMWGAGTLSSSTQCGAPAQCGAAQSSTATKRCGVRALPGVLPRRMPTKRSGVQALSGPIKLFGEQAPVRPPRA